MKKPTSSTSSIDKDVLKNFKVVGLHHLEKKVIELATSQLLKNKDERFILIDIFERDDKTLNLKLK